jgi:hypothetical protein
MIAPGMSLHNSILILTVILSIALPEAVVGTMARERLPQDELTSNFIAKNYGPKYLNTENRYKIIAPLATGKQSANKFTVGTITMSPRLSNYTDNPTPSTSLSNWKRASLSSALRVKLST